MDLGENVEVSVNIEERVERRALIYIFNSSLLFKRKVGHFFDFCKVEEVVFLEGPFFLPLWLPPSCSVGCWFGCRTWPLYHQLTLVQFLMINSILMVLVFSRWYSGSHTCFSSTLLLAGQSFVHWGLATTCVKFIFSFLDFAKDLRKWSRVFSAPCMEIVESSEWWKYCKLKKVVIGEQGNQIDAQSR